MKKKLLLLFVAILMLGLIVGESFATPEPPVMTYNAEGINITINWTAPSGATGYRLYYAPYPYTGPDSIDSFDLGNVNTAFYSLWPGAAYFIAVSAYDDGGESAYSNIGYFIMGPPTPEWVDDDGDGFTEYQGDCQDDNSGINPAATDICDDGIDQDCSGADEICDAILVEAPTFEPAPATFTSPQFVTLASATDGATIYYTTDGSTPSTESNVYSSPLEISTDQTIKAIAVKEGLVTSTVTSGDYTFFYQAVAPNFTPSAGVYDAPIEVVLGSATPGATFYYTTDGTTPTTSSTLYSPPLMVSESQTIKAIAVKDGMADSPVASAAYTITNQAFAPTFSRSDGVFYVPQSVSLSSQSVGAQIRYTTNGLTPTGSSSLYTSPLTVSESQTINAIAVKAGVADSEVSSQTYTIRTVAGVWALRMVTGSNSCGQTVGEETILGNVTVTQNGSNITVSSQLGTETGTLNGNTLSWSMSYPVETEDLSGTLSISMQLTMDDDGNSFSGPVNFTFTGSPLSCNGTGTVYGTR